MYREDQLKDIFSGRRILIAGYGREGRSAEALVKRLLPQAQYSIADGDEQVRTEAGRNCYDLIVKSPGIPMRLLGERHAEVTSITDIFMQVYADQVIGVTGTKGKSTTASLIHHLLPGSILAGNIGIPLFDVIDEMDEHSLVVAELSCHQLEVLHRAPHVAVLLNLYQEHLDHYDSYMDYKMAKMQIGLRQQPDDHLFWCSDAAEMAGLVRSLPMPGVQHPYSIGMLGDEERRLLEACPLVGEHNRSNALVACLVASLVTQQPLSEFRTSLSTFTGLRHRLERVGEWRNITWYDDSISTIPEAAIAAVKALERVDTLIIGGFDRGIDYTPLVAFLQEHPVEHIVFVGAAGRRIKSQFPILDFQYTVEDDYTKIVPWCASVTPKGGTVLLSPAAASYDAFKNFEHRGDFYREQILKL